MQEIEIERYPESLYLHFHSPQTCCVHPVPPSVSKSTFRVVMFGSILSWTEFQLTLTFRIGMRVLVKLVFQLLKSKMKLYPDDVSAFVFPKSQKIEIEK
jgi:hypothetical protein